MRKDKKSSEEVVREIRRQTRRKFIIAAITDLDVIRAFLDSLGIPREDVTPAPARPPPDPEGESQLAFE